MASTNNSQLRSGVQCVTGTSSTVRIPTVGAKALPHAMGGTKNKGKADDRVRLVPIQAKQDPQGLKRFVQKYVSTLGEKCKGT